MDTKITNNNMTYDEKEWSTRYERIKLHSDGSFDILLG